MNKHSCTHTHTHTHITESFGYTREANKTLYAINHLSFPEYDPWVGRSPGEGHGNPLHYSCLANPTGRGAWWATAHGVTKSQTRLSN